MDTPDCEDGFTEAFDRYAPAILRYARRRLDNQDTAWDVVTDTFTSAWRHWDRRPEAGVLLPWLYAIAANSVRDQRRSTERRRRLSARLAAMRLGGHGRDPAEGVVLGSAISEALARLPEADREILRLIAWEGQTDARALSLILGVSPVAVRSRVHRARRRLRVLLDDADGAPGSSDGSDGSATSRASTAHGAGGSAARSGGAQAGQPAPLAPPALCHHPREA